MQIRSRVGVVSRCALSGPRRPGHRRAAGRRPRAKSRWRTHQQPTAKPGTQYCFACRSLQAASRSTRSMDDAFLAGSPRTVPSDGFIGAPRPVSDNGCRMLATGCVTNQRTSPSEGLPRRFRGLRGWLRLSFCHLSAAVAGRRTCTVCGGNVVGGSVVRPQRCINLPLVRPRPRPRRRRFPANPRTTTRRRTRAITVLRFHLA